MLPNPTRHEPTSTDIVRLARSWVGTPYHHQASTKGAGADCLGLVRGVWRELYGCEAETPPAYSRDWGEANGRETLLDAAARHLVPLTSVSEARPGDILVFRLRADTVAKHAAILVTPAAMIHAMEGGDAREDRLSPWWRRRLAAAYRFPGIDR